MRISEAEKVFYPLANGRDLGGMQIQFELAEHGPDALSLMAALKTAFDPNNILNPGKIIPPLHGVDAPALAP